MKILKVRFKNLNSLAGEWVIDFTHPDYESEGIFAVTGPTGAGKSTILDSICLGLYGETPRLNKVTKNNNEIMSRHTGECFAEVCFETSKGSFRCHWSQHRARKNPDGELQSPKHEIAEAGSGKILASKLRDVGACVEKVTGMDFERFTRSMLLAQGGFAAFLQAPADERAPILEQITGTELYSRISMRVHEIRAGERNKLDILKAELKGIQLLSRDQVAELETALKTEIEKEKKLSNQCKEIRAALVWKKGIEALEKELDTLEKQKLNFENRQRYFEIKAKKLSMARKAMALENDYTKLSGLRSKQGNEIKEIDEAKARRLRNESDFSGAEKIKQKQEENLTKAKQDQKQESDIIKNVRELDLLIKSKRSLVKVGESSIKKDENNRLKHFRKAKEAGDSLEKEREAQTLVLEYLDRNASDAGLVENLAAIETKFQDLSEKNSVLRDLKQDMDNLGKEEKAAANAINVLEASHLKIHSDRESKEAMHRRLTEEIREMLQGKEISDRHKEMDEIKARKQLLEQARDVNDSIAATESAVDELNNRQKQFSQLKTSLSEEVRACLEKSSAQEKEISHLETQTALLSRIQNLEEERNQLEDGKPCPLCGAEVHPFALGNAPVLGKTELELRAAKEEFKKLNKHLSGLRVKNAEVEKDLGQAEEKIKEHALALDAYEKKLSGMAAVLKLDKIPGKFLSAVNAQLMDSKNKICEIQNLIDETEKKTKKCSKAQKALEKARADFVESEKKLEKAKNKCESIHSDKQRLAREYSALSGQIQKISNETIQKVRCHGIEELSFDALDRILNDLTQRRNKWRREESAKKEYEKNISRIEAEIEKQKALVNKMEEELEIKRKDQEVLTGALEELSKKRRAIYGVRDPDEEEKQLASLVDQGEKAVEKARLRCVAIEKELSRLKERTAILGDSISKRDIEIEKLTLLFDTGLNEAGFSGEEDYKNACLPEEERNRLIKEEDALNKEGAEMKTRQKDKTAALKSMLDQKVNEKPKEALDRDLADHESSLMEVQQTIGGIGQRLRENIRQRENQKENIRKIEARENECARWDSIHELIGSADGKKYRNFAQGLTYEIMITHANSKLIKMTDRYILIRDKEQPLELNVIDNYQAGEIRSTKNLSGGESFIVSLALALGLSQMASCNVRVDSLFLDEGFGTLDEDALETALSALAVLHRGGDKLIGVVSHVQALKERISTEIKVTPDTGGRSSISGPGCRLI